MDPIPLNTRAKPGGMTSVSPARARRSTNHAKRNETNEKSENSNKAHVPSEIGDQGLKLSPPAPGVVLIIMCQKSIGLPRSMVRKMPHKTTRGNDHMKPMRASDSSRAVPRNRKIVA